MVAVTRRGFILGAVAAGAEAAVPLAVPGAVRSGSPEPMPAARLPKPFQRTLPVVPDAVPVVRTPNTDYYVFRMRALDAEIVPGFRTSLWGYDGMVPGPTIRTTRGRKVVARFINELPGFHPSLGYASYTSVHLHGGMSKPQYDGYASDVVQPAQFKDYRWDNDECSRSLWYHDHAVHHTWTNVAMGLAGRYFISDPDDAKFRLPTGQYDVSLHISDTMFQADGQLYLAIDDTKGFWGDVVTVNGAPWPVMRVQRRKYRFRLVNGCVARSMVLRLSTGDAFQVIATDAGLMPAPATTTRMRFHNGERYDIVIDFAKYPPGTRVVLRNNSFDYNDDYTHTDKVMAFDVTGDEFDPTDNQVPGELRPEYGVATLPVPKNVKVRRFRTERQGGEWTVNGSTWNDVIDSNYQLVAATPMVGDVEMWEFHNSSGGWTHPMHVHGVDGRLVSRNGAAPFAYERGPKDTYFVAGNETLRVLMKFEHAGKYMIHCHNGVHEDHDMMVQYETVDPSGVAADDPFDARATDYTGQEL